MGSVPLPTVIATSQDAAAIDKLERKLSRAGAVLEIREPQEIVDFASQFAGLTSTVKSLSQKEKIALAGVTTIAIIAVIMVVGFLFGQEKKPPMKVEIAVKNKFTKTTSTATASVSSKQVAAQKKATPFVDFLVDLPSIKNSCSATEKKSNCILGQLRALSATASENQQKALSDESYLKALHHRLFLCLAEERSRPEEGDKKSVETGLRILAPYLFAQYGAKDCTSSRSAMYECVKSARAKSISNSNGHKKVVLPTTTARTTNKTTTTRKKKKKKKPRKKVKNHTSSRSFKRSVWVLTRFFFPRRNDLKSALLS